MRSRNRERRIVACHRSNGRRTVVLEDSDEKFDHPRLAGRFLAFGGGVVASKGSSASVERLDVKSGRRRILDWTGGFYGVFIFALRDLELGRDGSLAWIRDEPPASLGEPTTYTVRTAGPRGRVSTHDRSSAVAPDSLALSGRYVYWMTGGVAVSARL
jgi:hypothetical protein